MREFLYVDDLANLCVFLMNNYSGNETVNAGALKPDRIARLQLLLALSEQHRNKNQWV